VWRVAAFGGWSLTPSTMSISPYPRPNNNIRPEILININYTPRSAILLHSSPRLQARFCLSLLKRDVGSEVQHLPTTLWHVTNIKPGITMISVLWSKLERMWNAHCNVGRVGFVRPDSNRISPWTTRVERRCKIGSKNEGVVRSECQVFAYCSVLVHVVPEKQMRNEQEDQKMRTLDRGWDLW
jgi:hypothetical protein